jgi:hypothetical protein
LNLGVLIGRKDRRGAELPGLDCPADVTNRKPDWECQKCPREQHAQSGTQRSLRFTAESESPSERFAFSWTDLTKFTQPYCSSQNEVHRTDPFG